MLLSNKTTFLSDTQTATTIRLSELEAHSQVMSQTLTHVSKDQGGHFKISNLGADANLSEMLQN